MDRPKALRPLILLFIGLFGWSMLADNLLYDVPADVSQIAAEPEAIWDSVRRLPSR